MNSGISAESTPKKAESSTRKRKMEIGPNETQGPEMQNPLNPIYKPAPDGDKTCRLSHNIYVITNLFITNNYLFKMIRKIIFTNYFSEFIHQVAINSGSERPLLKKCFQSDIIFRHYVKMPPIKFRECLTKFMISLSLTEKFCCQKLITSIIVINITRNSSKSNKLRNINTIGCRMS